MTDRLDLLPRHREQLEALLRRHLPGVSVWAYGSRVRWNARPQSDLDLVAFASPEQRGAVSQLREAFEESSLPFSVDLLIWDDLPESFRRNIEAGHVVLQVNGMMSTDTVYGTFSSRFTESNLGNLCEKESGIQTGPFGSQLHQKDYVAEGTPIITVEHLGENRIIHQDLPRVSDYDRARLSKYALQTGDIVFSRVGSVDRRSLVRESEDGWLFSGRCLRVRPDQEKIDSGYLSYFLGLPAFREYIRSIAVGATMPSLNTSLLSDVTIYYPPLPEQRAIAHILGALDDKIELNRQMTRTLEEMARAIFQDWFVDFGPVRAKLEGREPYLPPELWALFPDRLVESELGEIPEGWDVKPLGEVTNVAGGTTPSTKRPEYWDEGRHCWATPKDLSSLSVPVLLDTERKITDSGLERIGSGLQPEGTVLLSSRAPIGYLAINEVPVAINQGFIAIQPRMGISNLFLLYWCKSSIGEILNHANGSTFLEISKSNFRQIPIITPSLPLLEAYHLLTSGLHERIVVNERSSRSLAAQRDALLPKLVSGETRIE